jgi:lipoprotein NlpI
MISALLLSLFLFRTAHDVPTEAEVFQAVREGKLEEAESLASKRIAADDKSGLAYLIRGTIRDEADKLPGAIEDLTAALGRSLEKKDKASAYNQRGMSFFKLGKIKESIADFDAYLKLEPKMEPRHWQRGIAYYYAGRFDEGRKQFEAYERVDGNDVENVVWRAMCVARKDGVAKSQANMAKVGFDRRVPMMTIYKLFKGEATTDEVMKAAKAGAVNGPEAEQRLFYAHLYIGLYSEIKGDRPATKDHLEKAVAVYPRGPYMWAVARTDLRLLEKSPE